MPLGIFLLGLLQLNIWKSRNGSTTELEEGLVVVYQKRRKLLSYTSFACESRM